MREANQYIYKGAIHIHTKLSDGTGNLKTVIKAAKKAGLDWIIITDHNYYDTDEGIFDGLYVIKGEEISPKEHNHYLAFNINEKILPNDNPQIYVDEVRKQGGFGFAAHPDEGNYVDDNGALHPRKNSHHCINWTDKNIKPDGVEIWNWFSNWADNFDDKNLYNLAYSYIHKHRIVTNPARNTLDWWDKLNNEAVNIIPAIGGVDAHALKRYRYLIPVTIFPYETCFNTITNFINLPQVLSKDYTEAKEQILNAIKCGHNTIINRHIYSKLPNIYITNSKGKYYCGEDIELDDNSYLHFEANETFNICLIYNGKKLKEYTNNSFIHQISKSGKYRLEVSYKDKGFLYTNPFNVKEKVEL